MTSPATAPSSICILTLSLDAMLVDTLTHALPEWSFHPTTLATLGADLASREPALLLIDPVMAETDALSHIVLPHLTFNRPVKLAVLIQALRTKIAENAEKRLILPGGALLLLGQRRVEASNAPSLALTEKETALLHCLLDAADTKRETLLKTVWGYGETIDTHTLDTHLYRLRAKLRELDARYDISSDPNGHYRVQLPLR